MIKINWAPGVEITGSSTAATYTNRYYLNFKTNTGYWRAKNRFFKSVDGNPTLETTTEITEEEFLLIYNSNPGGIGKSNGWPNDSEHFAEIPMFIIVDGWHYSNPAAMSNYDTVQSTGTFWENRKNGFTTYQWTSDLFNGSPALQRICAIVAGRSDYFVACDSSGNELNSNGDPYEITIANFDFYNGTNIYPKSIEILGNTKNTIKNIRYGAINNIKLDSNLIPSLDFSGLNLDILDVKVTDKTSIDLTSTTISENLFVSTAFNTSLFSKYTSLDLSNIFSTNSEYVSLIGVESALNTVSDLRLNHWYYSSHNQISEYTLPDLSSNNNLVSINLDGTTNIDPLFLPVQFREYTEGFGTSLEVGYTTLDISNLQGLEYVGGFFDVPTLTIPNNVKGVYLRANSIQHENIANTNIDIIVQPTILDNFNVYEDYPISSVTFSPNTTISELYAEEAYKFYQNADFSNIVEIDYLEFYGYMGDSDLIVNLDFSQTSISSYLYIEIDSLESFLYNTCPDVYIYSDMLNQMSINDSTNYLGLGSMGNLDADAPILTLDLTNANMLYDLNVNLELGSVDISNCLELERINLNPSELLTLDISNNTNLLYIDAHLTSESWNSVIQTLDQNGLENGGFSDREGGVRTTLSNTSYNNLIDKGWYAGNFEVLPVPFIGNGKCAVKGLLS